MTDDDKSLQTTAKRLAVEVIVYEKIVAELAGLLASFARAREIAAYCKGLEDAAAIADAEVDEGCYETAANEADRYSAGFLIGRNGAARKIGDDIRALIAAEEGKDSK